MWDRALAYWQTLPTGEAAVFDRALSVDAAAVPSMALANGVGNLGGFLGPWMFGLLRTASGGFDSAMLIGRGLYGAAGLLALAVRVRPGGAARLLGGVGAETQRVGAG